MAVAGCAKAAAAAKEAATGIGAATGPGSFAGSGIGVSGALGAALAACARGAGPGKSLGALHLLNIQAVTEDFLQTDTCSCRNCTPALLSPTCLPVQIVHLAYRYHCPK